MAKLLQQHVLAAIAGCLESGKYSDLTIKCGNDVHNVHKMIVCTQSDFFAAAIRFGGTETEQSNIDLPDDEPAIVKLLVRYLYTGDYKCKQPEQASSSKPATASQYAHNFPHTCNVGCCETLCPHHQCGYEWDSRCRCKGYVCVHCCHDSDRPSASDLLVHARVYEIADKYNITGLKALSRTKFSGVCKWFWDDEAFPVAAEYAFSTTVQEDKGLRDAVSDTIATHIELVRKPEIEVLMTKFSGLAHGILLKKVETGGWT